MTPASRDAEYDRFGPWAVQITEEDPPPPLFLPYLLASEAPLISVKIPRKIDRRNAHPGMNLYDYLITLYEEHMQVLQRVGDQVEGHTIHYEDVQYIRFSKELLKGSLYLQLAEQAFDIRFNTVSETLMRRLVNLIRQRYAPAAVFPSYVQDSGYYEDQLSYYFSGLLYKLTVHNPDMCTVALQPTVPVGQLAQSRARRVFYGVISKTLLESMHLSDGRELTIIDRGRPYKYGWQSIYGCSTYTLPLDRIQGADWNTDPHNSAIANLSIQLLGSQISFVFLQSNAAIPAYNEFLLTQANPVPTQFL